MQSYLKKDKVGHKFAAFCLIIFQTQMTLIIQIKNIKNPRHPRHLRHPRQSDSKFKFPNKLGVRVKG
jgi:hypothetical protein